MISHPGHSCGGAKNVVWNQGGGCLQTNLPKVQTDEFIPTMPTIRKSSIGVETRVVDPITGGEKGQKLARFDLIPNEFELALANHYGIGCRKYSDRNWEKGYAWSLSVAALRRHLSAWLGGESYDQETGSHHLIAVAWHAAALFVFELRGLGTDDVRARR